MAHIQRLTNGQRRSDAPAHPLQEQQTSHIQVGRMHMNGGSYDYAFHHVERFAEALEAGATYGGWKPHGAKDRARRGWAAQLRKGAAARQAIEWEDNGDCSPPHATEAIWACTGI